MKLIKGGQMEKIDIQEYLEPEFIDEINKKIQQEQIGKPIKVPKTFYKPHKLFHKASIWVIKKNLGRARRTMNTLLKEVEKRGMTVSFKKVYYREHLTISLYGYDFPISIREKNKQVKVTEYCSWREEMVTKNESVTTGVMRLVIVKKYYEQTLGYRAVWSDCKSTSLEECIKPFIIGLYRAVLIRKAQDEAFKREREERERIRRIEEAEKLKELEKQQRVENFFKDAETWHKAHIAEMYLAAAKKEFISKNGPIQKGSEFDEWMKWAEEHINRMNPLKNCHIMV